MLMAHKTLDLNFLPNACLKVQQGGYLATKEVNQVFKNSSFNILRSETKIIYIQCEYKLGRT